MHYVRIKNVNEQCSSVYMKVFSFKSHSADDNREKIQHMKRVTFEPFSTNV